MTACQHNYVDHTQAVPFIKINILNIFFVSSIIIVNDWNDLPKDVSKAEKKLRIKGVTSFVLIL